MSEPNPEPTPDPKPETDPKPDTAPKADPAAEVEKWKSLARKHEDRAKANATAATELEELRKSQMSEQEKAVATARDEARATALAEAAPQLVRLKFEAVAAGRLSSEQLDTLLEDVDMTKYLTDTGEVDTGRVTKKVDVLAPKADDKKPDFGGGPRGADVTAAGIDAQIAEATKAGNHKLAIALKRQKAYAPKT